jgi:hypothetical protein
LIFGDVDSQAVSFAVAGVYGFEIAALDLVQHGLSGEAEGVRGLVER